MINLINSVISPIWSIALLMLGSGFFMTYISNRLNIDGYELSVIGYVQSAYYIGVLIGALPVEKLMRRIGHIRTFALFSSTTTATILIQGLYIDPTIWFFMRLLAGISIVGQFIVIESWLLEYSTFETRGVILATYMVALYSAQAIGQFILDLVVIHSPEPFFVAALLCSISAIPVAFTRSQHPELHEPTVGSIFKLFVSLYRSSPFGFSGCFASGLLLGAIYSFTPVFANTYDISVPAMVSLTIAGGIILQLPIGKFSDIFDRRKILIGISLLTLIPCILMPIMTNFVIVIYILSFLLGGLTFTVYPLSITQVLDRIENHNITVITGALWIPFGSGAALGPLIVPYFTQFLHIEGLYAYIGTISMILSAIGIYGLFQRPAVPEEEKQAFVALPPATPVAYDLDPRASTDEEQEEITPSEDPVSS